MKNLVGLMLAFVFTCGILASCGNGAKAEAEAVDSVAVEAVEDTLAVDSVVAAADTLVAEVAE